MPAPLALAAVAAKKAFLAKVMASAAAVAKAKAASTVVQKATGSPTAGRFAAAATGGPTAIAKQASREVAGRIDPAVGTAVDAGLALKDAGATEKVGKSRRISPAAIALGGAGIIGLMKTGRVTPGLKAGTTLIKGLSAIKQLEKDKLDVTKSKIETKELENKSAQLDKRFNYKSLPQYLRGSDELKQYYDTLSQGFVDENGEMDGRDLEELTVRIGSNSKIMTDIVNINLNSAQDVVNKKWDAVAKLEETGVDRKSEEYTTTFSEYEAAVEKQSVMSKDGNTRIEQARKLEQRKEDRIDQLSPHFSNAKEMVEKNAPGIKHGEIGDLKDVLAEEGKKLKEAFENNQLTPLIFRNTADAIIEQHGLSEDDRPMVEEALDKAMQESVKPTEAELQAGRERAPDPTSEEEIEGSSEENLARDSVSDWLSSLGSVVDPRPAADILAKGTEKLAGKTAEVTKEIADVSSPITSVSDEERERRLRAIGRF